MEDKEGFVRSAWCGHAQLIALMLGSLAASVAYAGDAKRSTTIEVAVRDGLLTLEAHDAPLAEVLRAIGDAASVRLVLRGELAVPISESFSDQPLEDAIRRLVQGHSLIIVRDDSAGGHDLLEIKVLGTRRTVEAAAGEETAVTSETQAQVEPLLHDEPADRATFRHLASGARPTKDDIVAALGEPDLATRVAALPKVSSLRPGVAVEILADVLAAEPDTHVKSRAIAALTRVDGAEATALLKQVVLSGADASLRMQALNALASTAGRRGTTALGHALQNDPESRVRMVAVRALQRVGGAWARGYLHRAARDLDHPARAAAEQALADWPQGDD